MAFLLLFAACTGPDDASAPTPYVDPGSDAWLFGEGADVVVNELSLELSDDAWDTLAQLDDGTASVVVPGTLGTPYGTMSNVGVRLAGKVLNSFQPMEGKPYFEIRTDAFVAGQSFAGLTRLRLYNQWQDESGLQRHLGFQMWRDAGYPAPRTGFATLTLNGVPMGLYGTNEGVDGHFVERVLGATGGDIYEGEYGNDFDEDPSEWDVVQGGADLADAERLAATIRGSESLEQDLSASMDVAVWHRHWALEMAVGAREGYTADQNNWYLAEDPATGLFTMLPWGFDQVLYDHEVLPGTPVAVLPSRGLDQPAFFAGQCDALRAVVAEVDWSGLEDVLWALDEVVPADLAIPGTDAFTAEQSASMRSTVAAYLRDRPVELQGWVDASCP